MKARAWSGSAMAALVPMAAAAVAAVVGAASLESTSDAQRAAATEWKPPEVPTPAFQHQARIVAASGIWGVPVTGATGAERADLTPPDWRVAGIAINGPTRVVYVQISKELLQAGIGDTLPGGAEIKGIEPGRLLLLVDGKRRVLAVDER
jgi:hypothetical protein